MTRLGRSDPSAAARNTRTASAKALGATISSCAGSYASPWMVRPSMDFCPEITRVGAAFPFASLANTAMRGWVTQLGTKSSSRFESYASAIGLPNPGVGVPAGALRIIRFGATLARAALSNASAE